MKIQNGKQITKEEQIAWFDSIKDDKNILYYIIYSNKKAIGYTSLKNINWQTKIGMGVLALSLQSVGHMGLVALLEETFDIMLETDDIIDLSSFQKGKEILSSRADKYFK